jgi:hypothetical protein
MSRGHSWAHGLSFSRVSNGRKLAPMPRHPLSKRKDAVNLAAYFAALRAQVPGLSSTRAQSPPPRRYIIDVIHERERARRALG